MTDEMHRRDFRLMKDMGAHFIRISHYPQDDALLEMCDRMGMLAWEEIPIIDIVPDTPGYGDNGIDIRFTAKSGKCFLNAIKLRKL